MEVRVLKLLQTETHPFHGIRLRPDAPMNIARTKKVQKAGKPVQAVFWIVRVVRTLEISESVRRRYRIVVEDSVGYRRKLFEKDIIGFAVQRSAQHICQVY